MCPGKRFLPAAGGGFSGRAVCPDCGVPTPAGVPGRFRVESSGGVSGRVFPGSGGRVSGRRVCPGGRKKTGFFRFFSGGLHACIRKLAALFPKKNR